MKLSNKYKIALFYGNALHIPSSANWVAANVDGRIKAFVEEPHVSHGFWEAETGAIWSIDADTKFGDENWKDTLTHCPHDQRWMIEAVAELVQAWNLYMVGLLPSKAKDLVLNGLADTLRYRDADNTLQAAWDSWMKHAVPGYLHDEDFTNELYNRLFLRHKDPESRIVKDYYGADVVVPGWTSWIAINREGSVMAFDMRPGVSPGDFWEYGIQDEQGQVMQVAWRDGTTSEENWRDSLREVQP